MRRYIRQLMIPQIGRHGQQRLADASVTVIGAGGLGSPVLTYLTAAGIGKIRIIDCDTVSESNLNRQFLHGEDDIGKRKTDSAEESLRRLNPSVRIETIYEKVTAENADRLIGEPDAAVDCVDSIGTRLLVNASCVRRNIPLVEGGVEGFYGYVTVVLRSGTCLACLGYDRVEDGGDAGSDDWAEDGGDADRDAAAVPALGAAAGVIGSLQAAECLKLLLGVGEVLSGRLLQYDGMCGSFDEIPVMRRPDCPIHSSET